MSGLSLGVLVALAVIGFVGGVGITAVGPGGVLPTIGLFLLTGLSPAQVAGTSLVTNVGTGALGAAAFLRSGELRRPHTRRTAALLGGTALVGAPLGVAANGLLSRHALGLLLGLLAASAAGLLLVRRRVRPAGATPAGPVVVAALGFAVAVLSGMVGIGGPMLTVPLLVVLGVPMLESLAASQLQSVVVAGAGSVGYLLAGAIDWRLALLVGVPELVGVLVGWRVARAVPEARLTAVLVVVLVVLAPYLALRG